MIWISGNEYLIYWIGAALCVVGGVAYSLIALAVKWIRK